MARNSSTQDICVDIVKFEVSSDNEDILQESSIRDARYNPLDNSQGSPIVDPTSIDHHQQQPNNLSGSGWSPSLSETISTSTTSTNNMSSNTTPAHCSELVRGLFGNHTTTPLDIDGNLAGSLASQLCPLGPKDRCTPSQAQAMGEQLLSLMATHEANGTALPFELQNTFDVFHRCLAVAYGTFFLNLYTKANAPCLLCHGCKSLYPPGQYIHHSCPALPPNIVPCRSRMWRRCLVPLMSQDMDKTDQKERWKFVMGKFSHASMSVEKRNNAHLTVEPQLLDMPENKKKKYSKGSKSLKNVGKAGVDVGNLDLLQANSTIPKMNVENINDENSTSVYTCISDDEQSGEGSNDKSYTLPGSTNGVMGVMGIVEDLSREVKKLYQELIDTKEQLKQTEARLKAVTSGDSLSEKFVQSLLAQENLTLEKKDLAKRLQLEEEKSSKLEKQLSRILSLSLEIQSEFKSNSS